MKYQAWVGGWRVLGVGGWLGSGGVGHGVGGWVMVGWSWGIGGGLGHGVGGGGMGGVGSHGVVDPHDSPHHGGHQMPPMLFFDNLVKKLDQISKK